jgi:Zn-dependent protease
MADDRPVTWLPPAPSTEPAGAPAPARSAPAWRRLLGPLAVAAALLLKFGAKLKVLLLLLPKVKLLTTSASMLVSIVAYALIFGWRFAVGFVLLLLVHELGHVIQLRREGIEASAPLFIPFLGAVVAAKSLGGNATAEARVGLAGPVLGTLGAAVVALAAAATDSELLKALAFTGFFLNLFNLLPVVPLDGGRAMAALAPWMWFVGFAVLVGLTLTFPNPVLLLVVLFGGLETWRRWKARRRGDDAGYYRVRPAHRAVVLGVYLALAVACAVGMDLTFVPRDLGDV